jgi:hypothetical protein
MFFLPNLQLVNNDQSLYFDVYINDEIFGMIAPIFQDLSQKNLSEDEAHIYIDQALEQIKKDFENPPSKEEIDKQVYEKMKKFSPKKPIRETLNADLPLAIDHFRYFAVSSALKKEQLVKLTMIPSLTITMNLSALLDKLSLGTSLF